MYGGAGTQASTSISKTFTETLKSDLELTTGSATSMHFKLTKRLKNGIRLQPDFRYGTDSFEVGFRASKKILKSVSLAAGAWTTFSDNSATLQSAFGVKLKLSKLSAIRYSVETEGTDLKFVTTLQRGGFRLSVPLLLSQVLASKALCMAIFATGVLSFFTKKLIDSFKDTDDHKDKAKKRLIERSESLRQADEFKLMVTDRAQAKLLEERSKRGLEIISAFYGSKAALQTHKPEEVVDVTVALQFLVQDSQLELAAVPKAGISGFYRPCLDEEPWLLIKYSYGGVVNQEYYEDTAPVWLPRR